MGRVFHDATTSEVDRLARALVATKLFDDDDDLRAAHGDAAWRIQVSSRGDVAVLGRWRDHMPILGIEALWCPTRVIPEAVSEFLDVARALGLADVVSPPIAVEEMHAYEAAGMHPQTIVATMSLAGLAGHDDRVPLGGVALRPAGHRDTPRLLDVDARCFDPFWRYDASHLARFCSTGRLVIAEQADEAVGYTLCTTDGDSGLLGRLCVVPDRRRQGTGSFLLAEAIHGVRVHGGERISLSTQTDNIPSQALYRQAGFRDTGRRYAFMRFGADEG
jgi:ribosomal-protein-alanine N-acetyltransferase